MSRIIAITIFINIINFTLFLKSEYILPTKAMHLVANGTKSQGLSAVEIHGHLKVEGNKAIDKNGNPVQLDANKAPNSIIHLNDRQIVKCF